MTGCKNCLKTCLISLTLVSAPRRLRTERMCTCTTYRHRNVSTLVEHRQQRRSDCQHKHGDSKQDQLALQPWHLIFVSCAKWHQTALHIFVSCGDATRSAVSTHIAGVGVCRNAANSIHASRVCRSKWRVTRNLRHHVVKRFYNWDVFVCCQG